jgi:hypothetical protein
MLYVVLSFVVLCCAVFCGCGYVTIFDIVENCFDMVEKMRIVAAAIVVALPRFLKTFILRPQL